MIRDNHCIILFCVLPYCVPQSRRTHKDHKVMGSHLKSDAHQSGNEEYSFLPTLHMNTFLVISRHPWPFFFLIQHFGRPSTEPQYNHSPRWVPILWASSYHKGTPLTSQELMCPVTVAWSHSKEFPLKPKFTTDLLWRSLVFCQKCYLSRPQLDPKKSKWSPSLRGTSSHIKY